MHANNFSRILARLHSDPWLIDPAAHTALVSMVERMSAEPMAGMVDRMLAEHDERARMDVSDGVAEIAIHGPLISGAGLFEKVVLGATDPADIKALLAEGLNRPDVRSVVLSVDSPGGTITGIPELAKEIRALSATKPVVAHSAGMMASAAYWLGAQARAVVATPSAQVGSIGVYIPYADTSKRAEMLGIKVGVVKNAGGEFKGMGYPGTSYTEAQMAHLQERADELFGMFKADILAQRPAVQSAAMRGQTLFGAKAHATGLVDSVGSYLSAFERASSMGSGTTYAAADVSPCATPTINTGSDARAEYFRLQAAGEHKAAGKFYAANRALIMSR